MVSEVRSTLIVSAIQTLRARGLYERYMAQLPPAVRSEVQSLIAGAWLPIELALEHYRAMDRLGLDAVTVEAIGGEVGERANKSMLSIVVRLSREAGVTPWTALAPSHCM